ncbi:MAG TPA: hypothetical protein VE218_12145 [Acidobacteriaceae bacterium]|jgi:hypothetical protein|nr:hypothetical protein [Acidobacteriaceae bacterium]
MEANIPEREDTPILKENGTEKTLKELLLSDEDRFEIEIPPRGQWKFRPVIRFEDD